MIGFFSNNVAFLFYQSYMKIFESDSLPEPKSMLEATAEANNLTASVAAHDRYMREMEEVS